MWNDPTSKDDAQHTVQSRVLPALLTPTTPRKLLCSDITRHAVLYLYIYIHMSENLGGGGFIDGFDGFLPVLAFFPLLRV